MKNRKQPPPAAVLQCGTCRRDYPPDHSDACPHPPIKDERNISDLDAWRRELTYQERIDARRLENQRLDQETAAKLDDLKEWAERGARLEAHKLTARIARTVPEVLPLIALDLERLIGRLGITPTERRTFERGARVTAQGAQEIAAALRAVEARRQVPMRRALAVIKAATKRRRVKARAITR